MQLRIHSRFLHRLVIKVVTWMLAFSLKEKVSRAEVKFDSFPDRLANAKRLYALYDTMYASEASWPRIGQQIRLDIRRATILYREALGLYEAHQTFVGPRLFFPQLAALEQILEHLTCAHTELTVTIKELNPSR